MLRITKAASALLLCATSTVSLGDFYAGIGGGPEWGDFKLKATVIDTGSVTGQHTFVDDKEYVGLRGGFGTVYAGYGYDFDSIYDEHVQPYLGLEVNFDLSTVKSEGYNREFVHQNFSETDFRIKRSYGASLLPGFLISDHTLLYLRAGYTNGRYELNTSDTSLETKHKNLDGFRYGAGIQQDIFEDIGVRVDWSTVAYRTASTFTRDPVSHVTKDESVSPQTSHVEFSVYYLF